MKEKEYSSWLLERIVIGDRFRLRIGSNTFGRHSSSNIRVIEATYISRSHAIFAVSENGETVTIQDVSSNGIYVNEKKYAKATVTLKNNDIIGIGVSPIDIDDNLEKISLPIYQLKYVPMGKFEIPPINNFAKPLTTNFENPSCSKIVKLEKTTVAEEIFEISDDDEFGVLANPLVGPQKEINNEIQEKLITGLNKSIDLVIKNEPLYGKDYINPSQKNQEKKLKDESLNEEQRDFEQNPFPEKINTVGVMDGSGENPKVLSNKTEQKDTDMPLPFISDIKKEQIRKVSANVQSIFGDIENDDEIQNTIKELNPLVYKEIHTSKNSKHSKNDQEKITTVSIINLSDDEDIEGGGGEELGVIMPNTTASIEKSSDITKESNKEMQKAKYISRPSTTEALNKYTDVNEGQKSPNLFDSSLDNSKEEENAGKTIPTHIDNIDLNKYTKYVQNSTDEDIEDLMFSQVIINDMKAELQDDINVQKTLILSNTNIDNDQPLYKTDVINAVNIKQEKGLEIFSSVPKQLENCCWIISDDEDYDEELETKVNDWSNKIFSQSFSSLSQNMSQVYEIQEPAKSDEEEDEYGEEDFNLLEDDIDSIADMYNVEIPDIANTHNKITSEVLKPIEEINNTLKTENTVKMNKTKNTPNEEIKVSENKLMDNAEIKELQEDFIKEKTSVDDKIEKKEDFQSPIIRLRRSSKTRIIIESPSSSEDELEIKPNTSNNVVKTYDVGKPIPKKCPPVIDAPILPKHRGKLRGVSAEQPKIIDIKNVLETVKKKIHIEKQTIDLKRKWIAKAGVSKKRDKEQKILIKELRRDKLKELYQCKNSPTKQNMKRKASTKDITNKAKIAKVKVTTHNRGAFLAGTDVPPATQSSRAEKKNLYKIPKITKKSDEIKENNSIEKEGKNSSKRSLSVDSFETFSQQISKPDELLFKRPSNRIKSCDSEITKINKHAPSRRNSTTDLLKQPTGAICKDAIAARAVRTTNKITFASMEKNIVESEESKRKLIVLCAQNTSLTSIDKDNANRKKKTVRFNETPIIHYIERVTGACKKINNKDVDPLTTYKERRNNIRNIYPIIDNTNKIISNILCWSDEWLIKRNAAADAAADVIYPMPTHFSSFEHYKSIIFPLMKLEFLSELEREYNAALSGKKFKVSLEYATLNGDRMTLVTKSVNWQAKEVKDTNFYDLVILEADRSGFQSFAFLVAHRKGAGSFLTIVYEIIAKNFTAEYFSAINELIVHPVMDKVRVHFGAFNSVYQLEQTPLFQKIINPIQLLNCRSLPKKKVGYCGFDKLNDQQKQVLLNTYVKIIDESTPNINLIQGPPGTGKSCVITNLVLQTLYGQEVRYLDKKILICAQSNAAVDVITAKLYDISMRMRIETRFRLIRFGMIHKMHPRVMPVALQKVIEHDQLKKLQAKNQNVNFENKENLKDQILLFETQVAEMSSRNVRGTVEENVLIEKKKQLQLMRNILNGYMRPADERSLFSWYLYNANIVCATLSSCVNLSQYVDYFDICIIDEATQCSEPWTLLPLKFGINSLVLVGDTQQLPATVLSKKANELGLGTSMFTRIQQCLNSVLSTSIKKSKAALTTPNILHTLKTQYRMHPEICRWPNQYFYGNELINAASTLEFNKSPLEPFSVLNLAYTQTSVGINGKITNNLEAEFVAKLLKALDGFIPNKYNSYGVITPYAHHRATLESSLRNLGLTNIMINTIDSYQGLEKDVIVISNARTSGVGFLSNPQRLNVALTRSKKCLILCGNFKTLETVPSWRCLLESARERKLYHELGPNCIEDIQTNVINKIKLRNQKQQR